MPALVSTPQSPAPPTADTNRGPSIPPLKGHYHTPMREQNLTLLYNDGKEFDLLDSEILEPQPTPEEFVLLQNHFNKVDGPPVDLATCSADEAIAALSAEIQAIRYLVHGYVRNFTLYTEKYDEKQRALHKEIESLWESYQGLRRLVVPAFYGARDLSDEFNALRDRIATLEYKGPPMPRISVPVQPGLTKEEEEALLANRGDYMARGLWLAKVNKAADIAEKAILHAQLNAPRRPPPPAARRVAHEDTPELRVAVQRIVGDVADIRDALKLAFKVNDAGVQGLRQRARKAAHAHATTRNLHETMEGVVYTSGDLTKNLRRRVKGFKKWADACETPEGAPVPVPKDCKAENLKDGGDAAQDTKPKPFDESDLPDSSVPAPAADESPSAATVPFPDNGELYAVTLDISPRVPYEEMTREQLLAALKQLPLKLYFTPGGDAAAAAKEAADAAAMPPPSIVPSKGKGKGRASNLFAPSPLPTKVRNFAVGSPVVPRTSGAAPIASPVMPRISGAAAGAPAAVETAPSRKRARTSEVSVVAGPAAGEGERRADQPPPAKKARTKKA